MSDDFKPFEPSPEAELTGEMMRLQEGWEQLGIDADDFLRCGHCHKFIPDLVEGTEPPLSADELCRCREEP